MRQVAALLCHVELKYDKGEELACETFCHWLEVTIENEWKLTNGGFSEELGELVHQMTQGAPVW